MSGNDKRASNAIIWLIGFFAFLNVYSMQAVLPLVMQDFHASPLQAGATVGATVLAVALVSPFIGMLSDALGRKVVLCVSLFGLTLPTALIPAAASLELVVVLRFLQGLFIPGIVVSFMAYIAEEFSADAVVRITGIYVGGSVMGGFSGRFITGHASHLLGWRGAFLGLAALNFAGAVLTVWLLPASRHFVARRDVASAMSSLGQHLRNPRLLAACAVGFFVLFSLVGTFTYVNLLLSEAPFKLTVAGLANVFCVYLVGVVVTPLAGRLMVRLGLRRALVCALALSSAGLLLTLLPYLAIVIAGLTICSSGVFVCQAATIAFIAESVSEGRSLATGIYYLGYYAGGAVGTWIAGLAYEGWGWDGSVGALIGGQMLAAAIAWFGWRGPADKASSRDAHLTQTKEPQ